VRLAVDLHEHLVEMPLPVPEPAHAIDPLTPYCEPLGGGRSRPHSANLRRNLCQMF
jgi:hypothetical protein